MAQQKGRKRRGADQRDAPGAEARRLAIEVVRRIDEEGAYANLLLPSLLVESTLEQRDKNLVTEMVYGATRMRRSLDWLVDRFIVSPPAPALRASLRVGAYQLAFMRVPAHAAVSATVSASAKRNRPPVNAILRKVAGSLPEEGEIQWPSDAIQLSYPDWIIDRLIEDLGAEDAEAMLATMNTAPEVIEREDGYIQDTASQWVVDAVDAQPGDRVLDLCAAPGGKATALAGRADTVVASDNRPSRVSLVASNVARLGLTNVVPVASDATQPPFAAQSYDRVLVDAPCSGLGVLRRRPDARWRVQPNDVTELASLQQRILSEAASLVRPGGVLVYSVCTVTKAETVDVVQGFLDTNPQFTPSSLDPGRWRSWGPGGMVLPQDHNTDAMAVFVLNLRAS